MQKNTPAAGHQKLFPTSNETLEIGEGAQKSVEASIELVNEYVLVFLKYRAYIKPFKKGQICWHEKPYDINYDVNTDKYFEKSHQGTTIH